jgi:hypothetical protein
LRLRSPLQVRKAAVTALPELINDAFLAVQNPQVATDPAHDVRWVKAMLDAMLAGLCEAALKEPETEIVASMLEAIKETIDYAGELLQVRVFAFRHNALHHGIAIKSDLVVFKPF